MESVLTCNICHGGSIQTIDPSYNFCRCDACGFVFDSPRPTAEEIASFYSQASKYDSWIREGSARDALWQRRIKKLIPQFVAGTLLDIGTGVGQFLHHARHLFSTVQGTEVSESGVRIAREKYSLDVRLGQVEELNLPSSSFDNITLFHVLEHVPDPSGTLDECRRLMQPNGMLAIAVPNDVLAWTSILKRFGSRIGFKSFRKFSPRLGISKAGLSSEIHLSHFTPAVLRQLLQNRGFRIVEESIDPYYCSSGARLLLDHAYYYLHLVLFACFRINRYETIWMISRKSS
jgi:ubiquinone/menaquinone biosynthesis C-methylase UbiE